MIRTTLLGLAAAGTCLAGPLFAQDFAFTIDTVASASNLDANATIALPGTLIGDFDALTNPGGTSTLPGLFGGAGNNEIAADFGLGIVTSFAGSASGTFGMTVDAGAGTVSVQDLDLDLLGGDSVSAQLVLSAEFETFRTVQPTSLYIGGFPLDIPLGGQELTDIQLVQSGSAGLGVLTPTRRPGVYTFLVGVPAEVSFTIDGALTGTTPVGPIPVIVPMAGTLMLKGGMASVSVAFDLDEMQSLPDPVPGFVIPDVPLPLPTILPPGGTANLLFTAGIGSLDIDLLVDATFVANGEAACGFESYCPAATNTSGMAAVLAPVGLPELAAQTMSFEATNLPANQFGYLIASPTQDFVPFFMGGGGHLCLGAPIAHFRSQIQFSGLTSSMTLPIDFEDLPRGVNFVPGTTWNFQAWFRDVGDAPAHNTTNGVQLTWCP
tara:strand:- start:1101 stop:2408 length:1308 start_codon:yes stop_codon:yes gene_type:complete